MVCCGRITPALSGDRREQERAALCALDRKLDAAIAPASGPAPPETPDQLIDAVMARALHADACRDYTLVAWVALRDLPAYPERYAAQLAPSPTYTDRHIGQHPGDVAGWT